jgi:hypothetical protein
VVQACTWICSTNMDQPRIVLVQVPKAFLLGGNRKCYFKYFNSPF